MTTSDNDYRDWMPAELGSDERAALRRRTAAADPNGCPDCGRDIDRLGGNPDCPTCAAEPAQLDWCSVHRRQACTLCDECGHDGRLHAYVVGTGVAHTCWSQDLCVVCRTPTANDRERALSVREAWSALSDLVESAERAAGWDPRP